MVAAGDCGSTREGHIPSRVLGSPLAPAANELSILPVGRRKALRNPGSPDLDGELQVAVPLERDRGGLRTGQGQQCARVRVGWDREDDVATG